MQGEFLDGVGRHGCRFGSATLDLPGIPRGKIDGRGIAAAKKYADAFTFDDRVLRAIANGRRLQILDWLRSPTEHFPPQVDGLKTQARPSESPG